ncbi:hypothetical protein JCM19037_482 [Geomicrobium sp. JCM 19037]|uniref:hypothetical protein n=1 Tax=unclassified Geomicrobium TaxID=2628951 RepID=UPI00045F1FEB|nr:MULTISPECIES: hypothetical protein [unclassified Geomicrobium]GAK02259.1 hypothetical protein JCM19037_482 [Geomicrobium sp. JCM 19037]GAK14529.1 hypothetical protein JCM19039_4458 [Geomicrobium sp. JCM 19039]
MKKRAFDWTVMWIYLLVAAVLIVVLRVLGYDLPWYALIIMFVVLSFAIDIFVNMVRRDRAKQQANDKQQ